jgi:cell division protein FtsQ
MNENNKRRVRKKKKRKNRKLLVSTAAFITAAVVVVVCICYIYYDTPYFDLANVDIDGNLTYSYEYIMESSGIERGKKIFDIDRSKIKENLEKEVYIENVRVIYELPNTIFLDITERFDKYQVSSNSEYIIIDKNGIVLRVSNDKSGLLTIESYTDIVYNIGDNIQFAGVESNNEIFNAIDYLNNEYGSDAIKSYIIDLQNSFLFETHYGTLVRIDLSEDVKYQIVFAMKIINERLNNNLTVATGLIDFTKGDSPVYIED